MDEGGGVGGDAERPFLVGLAEKLLDAGDGLGNEKIFLKGSPRKIPPGKES